MESTITSFASPDVIGRTSDWFVAVKQQPEIPEPNVRQTAFYTGMQCEELTEKLEAILGLGVPAVEALKHLADGLKVGTLDNLVGKAFAMGRAKDLLDADIDMLWVTVGGSRAQGADVALAYNLVAEANWDKRDTSGEFVLHPETGKVVKRDGWLPPDLTPAVHPALRFEPGTSIDDLMNKPADEPANSEGGAA